eukprot:1851916-Rhodomonas_salina.1
MQMMGTRVALMSVISSCNRPYAMSAPHIAQRAYAVTAPPHMCQLCCATAAQTTATARSRQYRPPCAAVGSANMLEADLHAATVAARHAIHLIHDKARLVTPSAPSEPSITGQNQRS